MLKEFAQINRTEINRDNWISSICSPDLWPHISLMKSFDRIVEKYLLKKSLKILKTLLKNDSSGIKSSL